MLKNFFKIAFRNLVRHKGFSFINIAGLALGLTACLLIGLFVWDEKQYDKFIPGGEQVYRVYNEHTGDEGLQNMAVTSPMYASTLQHDFPEVEQTARIMMTSEFKFLFELGDNKAYEQNGLFVDSTFVEVLPLSTKFGSLSKSLDDPGSIVISEELATRFFKNEDPVGKQISFNKVMRKVTAVFRQNNKFHLQFHFLVAISSMGIPKKGMEAWQWQQFYTYVKLKKGTNVEALQTKFRDAVKQKAGIGADGKKYSYIPFFQRLQDIHLYSSNFKFDKAQRGNIQYVNALNIIAVFIMLIACFNFVNLATARSLQRAKEVGVRKTIGASRRALVMQFIGETILLAFISIIIAVALTMVCIPWLNSFTNKHISIDLFAQPLVMLLLFAIALVVGIIAGFYPAMVLSGFKPVKVLKAALSYGDQLGKIQWLRHGLVVVQFSLAILLIISSIIVFRQVNYLHNKDLGFNKEQVMFFPMRGDKMFKSRELFKEQLQQSPGISSVSIGYGFPGDAVAGDRIIVPDNGEQKTLNCTQLMVDHDYIKTLGLKVVAGRDFSRDMKTDPDHAFIINETAVRELGFGTSEKALGKTLSWPVWGAKNPDSLKTGQIIGIVKDFNYKSLYDKIEPAVLQIFPDATWKVAIKMNAASASKSIAHVTTVWNRFTPEYPLEYKFLDENFEAMYDSEDKLNSLLWIFTGIAVFVGCLGLFGLAAFSAERRKKEVGIRKVLGASVRGVVMLLSKDFIKLVVISLLIASPLAYYFMHDWLNDFAFRINISWWIFGIAAVGAIGIAFLTVGYQAIRSATANPVKSLRTE